MAILETISMFIIFNKIGESGWKSLVPPVKAYTMGKFLKGKITGRLWVISQIAVSYCALRLSVVFLIIFGYIPRTSNTQFVVYIFGLLVFGMIHVILMFKFYRKLCRSFSKSTGFYIGLLFIRPVFISILAFDKNCICRYRH